MLSQQQVRSIRSDLATGESRLAHIFGALSDVGRFQIFRLLLQYEDLCVTDVANVLGVSVPAASQQLKVMEISGLVEKEREGQMICYRVRTSDPVVRSIVRIAEAR